MSVLECLFWSSLAIVFYAYVGYGLLIALLSLIVRRPVVHGPDHPSVTVIVAAFNEETEIASKIENSLSQAYPPEKLDILIVADGSTDRTCEIVRGHEARGVRLLFEPERRGKGHAVSRAVPHARGEVLVLSDANALFRPDAVKMLVRSFADPRVALVAGEKRIAREPVSPRAGGGSGATVTEGEGLYWRYESLLKRLDSRVGSAMGAAGEILAVRKALYRPPPPDTILDDFTLSMGLVRDGWRVVYEPEAVAVERASPGVAEEFKRKARTVAGGFQAVVRLRGLLSPRHGLAAFQFFSHRVLRWMVVPFLLPLLLVLNAVLALVPGAAPGRRARQALPRPPRRAGRALRARGGGLPPRAGGPEVAAGGDPVLLRLRELRRARRRVALLPGDPAGGVGARPPRAAAAATAALKPAPRLLREVTASSA